MEIDIIRIRIDQLTSANEQESGDTEDIIYEGTRIGRRIYLEHLTDGRRGHRWLILLNDNRESTISAVRELGKQYCCWPDNATGMILEVSKKYREDDNDRFSEKEYTLLHLPKAIVDLL